MTIDRDPVPPRPLPEDPKSRAAAIPGSPPDRASTPIGRLIARWSGVNYRALGLALVVGAVGGSIFAYFQVPLAWMIGAMVFTATFAIASAGLNGPIIKVPKGLRAGMVMILGIMLGSAFTPDILDQLDRWAITLVGLVPYILVCLAVGLAYMRLVVRVDPVTAYFTAAPGGFNEMILQGAANGGDERTIALTHSARVMTVVITLPVLIQLGHGFTPTGERAPIGPGLFEISVLDYGLLALCVIGAPIGKLLRLPAAQLTGPMILSAVIHLAGLTDGKPPLVFVAVAQIVVGSAIGCRFAGVSVRRVLAILAGSLGLTVVLLGVTVGFAWALNAITGIPILYLVLAYAPGGLAEMSLVALALGADAAFVSIHHIVRIVLVIAFAPLIFLTLRHWIDRRRPPAASTQAGED